jgi:hypothetical protein
MVNIKARRGSLKNRLSDTLFSLVTLVGKGFSDEIPTLLPYYSIGQAKK